MSLQVSHKKSIRGWHKEVFGQALLEQTSKKVDRNRCRIDAMQKHKNTTKPKY